MRKLGILGVALIGLWVLATAPGLLLFASAWLASLAAGGQPGQRPLLAALLSAVPFVVALAVGFALIARRARVVDSLIEDSPLDLGDEAVLLGTLVVLLGVAIGVSSLTGLLESVANGIGNVLMLPREAVASSIVLTQILQLVPGLLARLFELALALLLVFRSRQIVAWIESRQRVGA